MTRFATPLFLLAALALVSALPGCASAEGAYDDAMEAEVAGDLPTAFDRYHTALRRDGSIGNARGRLEVVGRQIVEGSLGEAATARPVRAADLYLLVEQYVARAAEVGVRLAVPASFEADREAAFAGAVSALVAAGADARDGGAFSDALGHLRRADAYRPRAEERARLDGEARLTYTRWAEADLAAGQFRRAYASTQSALALGADAEAAAALAALQDEIVAVGSIRVAFFPLSVGSDTDGDRGPVGRPRTRPPVAFVADLEDVLNDDHWTRPPLFILSADPADVRRLLRRERDADDLIRDRPLMAVLSRDLDAHLGAAMEAVGWTETDEERERETRTAGTRSGGTGTYARVRLRLTRGATVEYAVIDADTRRVVCEGDVSRDVQETITVHEAENWRELQVDRDDRRLFTEDHRDEEEARLRARLLEQLAGAVAERLYRCVGQQVP